VVKKSVLKTHLTERSMAESASIAHLATLSSAPPPPGDHAPLRRRLPHIVGVSLGHGASRTVRIENLRELESVFSEKPGIEYFADFDWSEFVPSPDLVEFTNVEGQTATYFPGERTRNAVPTYVSFAELARSITDEFGYGDDARLACAVPTASKLREVERFVARYGLLAWGSEHSCYHEPVVLSHRLLGEVHKWDRPSIYCAFFRNAADRYVNSVPWILREALVLRRAIALWNALREVRSGGSGRNALNELWGWQRGKGARLFDHPSFQAQPGERWESVVRISVFALFFLIDSHIEEARAGALMWPETWRRPTGGSYGSAWLKPATTSDTPLILFWLAFFNDILWLTGDRRCGGCGVGFTPRRPNQLHCTPLCGARVRNRRARASVGTPSAKDRAGLLERRTK
jgi:hypothetical protein